MVKLTAYYKVHGFEEEICDINYEAKEVITSNDSGASSGEFKDIDIYADIYCCKCDKEVHAKQVTGKEIYPHREDLYSKLFYSCPHCNNYVGTHKGVFIPLGIIPTPELRKIRMEIHAIIDPLWKTNKISRGKLYQLISNKLGYEYHNANIKSIAEANTILTIVKQIIKDNML